VNFASPEPYIPCTAAGIADRKLRCPNGMLPKFDYKDKAM
jgi:hypothetical protein